jgi:hypothetical protein
MSNYLQLLLHEIVHVLEARELQKEKRAKGVYVVILKEGVMQSAYIMDSFVGTCKNLMKG